MRRNDAQKAGRNSSRTIFSSPSVLMLIREGFNHEVANSFVSTRGTSAVCGETQACVDQPTFQLLLTN